MPQTTSSGEQLPAQGGDIVVMQPGTLHRGDNNIIPKSHIYGLNFDHNGTHIGKAFFLQRN